jgi:hypothetical protein
MPYYLFERPDTGDTTEVFFHMSDDKVFNGEDGTEVGLWKRVYVNPQVSTDTNIDPFDKNAFINTQHHKRETLGTAFDRSAELSEKRAALRGGVDPIKKAALDNYAAKRHGKRHPDELKQGVKKATDEANKALSKLGIKINLNQPVSRRLAGKV